MTANVGYHYHEHQELTFTEVAANVAFDAGDSWAVDLLDQAFDGGILAEEDFVTEYEGFIYTDVSSGVYQLSITVAHTIGTVTFTSRPRTEQLRIGNNVHQAWALSVFNTRSQVMLGEFTTAGGETITITEEMLAESSRIVVTATLQPTNAGAWTLMRAEADLAAVTFWQLQPTLPAASVSVNEIDSNLTARILPEPSDDTRGYLVRQSPSGNGFELVRDPTLASGARRTTALGMSSGTTFQQTYATLASARIGGSGSLVTMDHLISASRLVQRHRTYDLIDPARELRLRGLATFSIDLDDSRGFYQMPYPASNVTRVQIAETEIALDEVRVIGMLINVPQDHVGVWATVDADWGDGTRGRSVTYPNDWQAADRQLVTPDPLPTWWEAGRMLCVEDEVVRIDSVEDAVTHVTRDPALALTYTASVTEPVYIWEVVVPTEISLACIGIARRIAWQLTQLETPPKWESLISGYEEMLERQEPRVGRIGSVNA